MFEQVWIGMDSFGYVWDSQGICLDMLDRFGIG
jgi:hypothetical protein